MVTTRKTTDSPFDLAQALNTTGGNEGERSDDSALNGTMNGGSRQHSLAHELAYALMPEPSAGSKLLAEELGIEYDESVDESMSKPNRVSRTMEVELNGVGRRGDEELLEARHHALNGVDEAMTPASSVGNELTQGHSFADGISGLGGCREESLDDEDLQAAHRLGSPVGKNRRPPIQAQRPEADSMDVLAQDLESTEQFLKHLRTLDNDSTSGTAPRVTPSHMAQQPTLERFALDIIRKIDESARSRESQLRELLEYDREFRKIASEVNGTEVLSRVDELPLFDDDDVDADHDFASTMALVAHSEISSKYTLDTVTEDPEDEAQQSDWDDPHAHLHHDLGEDISPSTSSTATPTKAAFAPLPPSPSIPTFVKTTPANAILHLTHVRTFTSSLILSLTTLSEQAQVNGTATTEAGRKIKALKNKMGGWQSEWESAERSRVRIERWEAGIVDWQNSDALDEVTLGSVSPARLAVRRRVDGRKLVEEHLSASEKTIREATERTQAIMAR